MDWTQTMQQTFEYFIVDPITWEDTKQLTNVIDSRITRDLETDTLGSLTITIGETIGECYIRIYLVAIQNGIKQRFPLGTFLVQTPTMAFNGKRRNISLDAYSPLLELKEKKPALGYSVPKDTNVMDISYRLTRENVRAPVVETVKDVILHENFIANVDDNWLVFIKDLIANAEYELMLDELGRILFMPIQDTAALQPIWTYDDSNSSILQPTIDVTQDLYGIPNVVEVIYSNNKRFYSTRAVNDDPNSPTSTVNRGREIIYRDTNPSTIGNPTDNQLDEYAKRLLRNLSCLEYRITYHHGYCPVRIGDCIRLNYERAGLKNIKARVISQTIDCKTGCSVTETAVFTNRLWR